ncbi:MAG: hypothetical protein ACRCUY_03455 [Thermoguttaceae bacterium]
MKNDDDDKTNLFTHINTPPYKHTSFLMMGVRWSGWFDSPRNPNKTTPAPH